MNQITSDSKFLYNKLQQMQMSSNSLSRQLDSLSTEVQTMLSTTNSAPAISSQLCKIGQTASELSTQVDNFVYLLSFCFNSLRRWLDSLSSEV